MKAAIVTVVILLALGAGAHFGWSEYQERQAASASYAETLAQLELLVADVYVPPDRRPKATQKLAEHGCKEAWWTTVPRSAATRFSEAEKLATADPSFLARLRADESPSASYVLATLILKTSVAKRPELAGTDPEQLLRRAAAKGHGHASFYFARLLAEKYPHTEEPKAEQDAATFFDINRKLEQAADAGSGGAAYLLGFRTQADVLARFAAVESGRDRRAVPTSRSPREWWCRSAQLGYPPGQLQCYRVGKRPAEEARQLLAAAADGGHEAASAMLAALYASGKDGFPADGAKQKELLCRAVAFGDERSIATLERFEKAVAAAARARAREEARAAKGAAATGRVAPKAAKSAKAAVDAKPRAKAKAKGLAKPPRKKSEIKVKLAH